MDAMACDCFWAWFQKYKIQNSTGWGPEKKVEKIKINIKHAHTQTLSTYFQTGICAYVCQKIVYNFWGCLSSIVANKQPAKLCIVLLGEEVGEIDITTSPNRKLLSYTFCCHIDKESNRMEWNETKRNGSDRELERERRKKTTRKTRPMTINWLNVCWKLFGELKYKMHILSDKIGASQQEVYKPNTAIN